MEPKKNIKLMARKILLFQHRTTTRDIRQVVTSMPVIIAKPDHKKKMLL